MQNTIKALRREKNNLCVCLSVCLSVCVYKGERQAERDRQKERQRHRDRERETERPLGGRPEPLRSGRRGGPRRQVTPQVEEPMADAC